MKLSGWDSDWLIFLELIDGKCCLDRHCIIINSIFPDWGISKISIEFCLEYDTEKWCNLIWRICKIIDRACGWRDFYVSLWDGYVVAKHTNPSLITICWDTKSGIGSSDIISCTQKSFGGITCSCINQSVVLSSCWYVCWSWETMIFSDIKSSQPEHL